jgi:ribosomal protein S27E
MRPSIRCPKCGGSLSAPSNSLDSPSLTCLSCGNVVLNPDALVASSNQDDDWISLDTPVPPPPQPAPKPVAPTGQTKPTVSKPTPADKKPGAANPPKPLSVGPHTLAPRDDEPLEIDGVEIVELGDLFEGLPDSVPYPKSSPENYSPAVSTGATVNAGLSGNLGASGNTVPVARPGNDEYRVKCKVCDSISYARPSQAGTTMICNDCTSTILIPPPPPAPKPKPVSAQGPAALSVGVGTAPASPDSAPSPSSVLRPEDPFRKSASELLEKAAIAEASEQPEDNNYDVPSVKEWLHSVLGVMKELTVFAHWLIFTVAASVVVMFALWTQHPIIVFSMFPFGGFFGLIVLSSGFAILQSASANLKSVEDWPSTDSSVWFENAWITAASTAISGAPMFLLTSFVFGANLVTFGMTLFSIFALFPFVLLSILDNGSAFAPFSAEVARSVQTCKEPWGAMYFSSAILFGGLFFLAIIVSTAGVVALIPIVVGAAVATVFIYFAMIGRLAYAIGQSLAAEKSQ